MQQGRSEESSEQKYYEEEERKTSDKLNLELLSKEKLQERGGIMTFRLAREGLDYAAGQFLHSSSLPAFPEMQRDR